MSAHRYLGLGGHKGVAGGYLHGVPVAWQRGDVADGQESAGLLLLRRQRQLHGHHHLRLRLLPPGRASRRRCAGRSRVRQRRHARPPAGPRRRRRLTPRSQVGELHASNRQLGQRISALRIYFIIHFPCLFGPHQCNFSGYARGFACHSTCAKAFHLLLSLKADQHRECSTSDALEEGCYRSWLLAERPHTSEEKVRCTEGYAMPCSPGPGPNCCRALHTHQGSPQDPLTATSRLSMEQSIPATSRAHSYEQHKHVCAGLCRAGFGGTHSRWKSGPGKASSQPRNRPFFQLEPAPPSCGPGPFRCWAGPAISRARLLDKSPPLPATPAATKQRPYEPILSKGGPCCLGR